MPAVRTVAVIGGGIAGPVAATALAKAGIPATVYEAYPSTSNGIGSDLALAPNGIAALDLLDAGNAVRRMALPITRSTMTVGGKDLGALPALAGVEPLHMVDRGRLHRILHDTAVAAGVDFVYDKRLIGVEQYTDSVTACFADGTSAKADLLVGADGVRSTVRRLIDPSAPEAGYTGLLGFAATVPMSVGQPVGTVTFAFGRRAYYLYWTLPDGRVTWAPNLPSGQYLSLAEARAIPSDSWLAEIRATYADDRPGADLAEATTAESLEVLGAIHIMPPVAHWHRGRAVLVGDAVHAPSNSTGQGASLAIESAIELAHCLRDLDDIETALVTYEALRRPRVEKITARGARANRTKTPGPVARKLMQLAMPVFFARMDPEKMLGAEQRFRIDWDAAVQAARRQ